MKTRILFFVMPVLMVVLGWQGRLNAQCPPNGHIFNVESLTNANLLSQFDESVAFLLNPSGNGKDVVVGAAEDKRPLVEKFFPYNDAFYVGRDSSNCAAAVDGGMPFISFNGELFAAASPTGPQVAADPAHRAIFFADLYLAGNPDVSEIAVLKATAADLLDKTKCPDGTITNS